jgi:Flp pilus assembly protein CpaB
MQSKTPLLMVTALVCGLGAAFGTWKLVSGAQAQPTEDKMVKVIVPVADIPSYHLFQDRTKFTEKEFPKSKLREAEEETITNFDQIKGKTSRHYKLRLGEPVYRNDICDSIENDIAERLKPGEVAEGIPVSPEDGGGFINVGDRVDIAATTQASAGQEKQAQYILEAIEVLAVDNKAQKTEADPSQVTPPSRFLLRVTRQQALVLSFFRDTAKLKIFKRRIDDPQILGDSWVFTMGKKPSSAQRYQEEPPEATQQFALAEHKLPDPKTDETQLVAAPRINNAKPEEQAWETQEQRSKVNVKINDSGSDRVVPTNDHITRKTLVPKKDEKKEENKDGKQDEKKGSVGN